MVQEPFQRAVHRAGNNSSQNTEKRVQMHTDADSRQHRRRHETYNSSKSRKRSMSWWSDEEWAQWRRQNAPQTAPRPDVAKAAGPGAPPARRDGGVAGAGDVGAPARRDGLCAGVGAPAIQEDGPPAKAGVAGGARPDGRVAAGAAGGTNPGAAAANPGPMVTGGGGPVRPAVPLLKLPDEWRLSMKKEDNVPNSSRDFSDVKRTCNRVLQRMYSEWQAEVANVRAMEHCTLQMAQANLLTANTCHQTEQK